MLLAAAKTNASIPTPIITPIIVPIKLLVEPLVVDGEANVEIALMIDNTRPMRANIHAGIIFEMSFDALTEQIPEIKPIIESKQIIRPRMPNTAAPPAAVVASIFTSPVAVPKFIAAPPKIEAIPPSNPKIPKIIEIIPNTFKIVLLVFKLIFFTSLFVISKIEIYLIRNH